jgi:hypothetical protein
MIGVGCDVVHKFELNIVRVHIKLLCIWESYRPMYTVLCGMFFCLSGVIRTLVEEIALGLPCPEHLVNFYVLFSLVHLHLQTYVSNFSLAVHSTLVLLVCLC